MYFSRVRFSAGQLDEKALLEYARGDAYSSHELIWKLFPDDPGAQRDFIFREERREKWPVYYVVSARQPQLVPGLLQVESKAYDPALQAGSTLGFSLRANPVVTQKDGDTGKRVRRDIFMVEKIRAKNAEPTSTKVSLSDQREKAALGWLQSRADRLGFSIENTSVRVDGYRRQEFNKPGKKHSIVISTLDYTGVLQIQNAEVFRQALFEGIGHAKAFGCGLMLVRRI